MQTPVDNIDLALERCQFIVAVIEDFINRIFVGELPISHDTSYTCMGLYGKPTIVQNRVYEKSRTYGPSFLALDVKISPKQRPHLHHRRIIPAILRRDFCFLHRSGFPHPPPPSSLPMPRQSSSPPGATIVTTLTELAVVTLFAPKSLLFPPFRPL